MRILVNHLTRMQPGYICVAGINLATTDHVRPVLAGRLGIDLLRRNGGPFDIGCVVDMGRVRHTGHAPEVEDHRFDPTRTSFSHVLDPAAYWEALQYVSHPALRDIFGDSLEQYGRSCTVGIGVGIASLGSLALPTAPTLYVDGYGKVRINITDGRPCTKITSDYKKWCFVQKQPATSSVQPRLFVQSPDGRYTANLSVTDLRLYEADHKTPRKALVRRIARRIREGERVILSVGLTRPFMKTGDEVRKHWLQVNNIHLENSPIWNESLR